MGSQVVQNNGEKDRKEKVEEYKQKLNSFVVCTFVLYSLSLLLSMYMRINQLSCVHSE